MLTKAFDTSQGPQIPKVQKKKRGPLKGKAKVAKKYTLMVCWMMNETMTLIMALTVMKSMLVWSNGV